MKFIGNKTFRDSVINSRKCFFSMSSNEKSQFHSQEEQNDADKIAKATGEALSNSNNKLPEGPEREELVESLSKNSEFFEEGGKEKFNETVLKKLEISAEDAEAIKGKLAVLYIDAQIKHKESLDTNKEDFKNRKQIHLDVWDKFEEQFKQDRSTEGAKTIIKEYLENPNNQGLLTESEKKSLQNNPNNFWKNQAQNLEKFAKKMAERPGKLENIQNRATEAIENKLSELKQSDEFLGMSAKKLGKAFQSTTEKINLDALPKSIAEKMKAKFIEKGKDKIKEAQQAQLNILRPQSADLQAKNQTLLNQEFQKFTEKKGLLKISFKDFEPTFDKIQKEEIRLYEYPKVFGIEMVKKFEAQKKAFAKQLETAKERAQKAEKIIIDAKEKAVNGDWKNLKPDEIAKRTNAELSQNNFFAGLPKSVQKLLGERLTYLWGKVEGDIKNRENKESKDKIPRSEMAAAWNSMGQKLKDYEQNFSSESKLKEFFIQEYFGDRQADAKAYLKNHPNFNKAIEAKFAQYSAEKKEADSAQNKAFEGVLNGVSNSTIKNAMRASFKQSTSYKQKQGWIQELQSKYIPRYEQSLSHLQSLEKTLESQKKSLEHSDKAQEIFSTIANKKLASEKSWKQFDDKFFSPTELERSLETDLAQLSQLETEWEQKNSAAKADIASMNLDEITQNASEKDLNRMKTDVSFFAKQFDVWMDDDVWKANEPNFKKQLLALHAQLNNEKSEDLETSKNKLSKVNEQKILSMTADDIDPTKITTAAAFAKAIGEANNIKMSPKQWEEAGGKELFTQKFNELWPTHQETIKLAKTMTAKIDAMDTNWLKKAGADKIKTRQDFDRALGNKNKIFMPEPDWNQWGADAFYAKADSLSEEFSEWQKENGEVGVNDLRDLGYKHQLDFKNVILKNTNNLDQKLNRLTTLLDSGKSTERWIKGNEKDKLPFLLEMLDTVSESEFEKLTREIQNKDQPEEIQEVLVSDNSRNAKIKKLINTHREEWNKFSAEENLVSHSLLGIEEPFQTKEELEAVAETENAKALEAEEAETDASLEETEQTDLEDDETIDNQGLENTNPLSDEALEPQTTDTENPETLNLEIDEINENDLEEPENIDTEDLEDTNPLSDEALETQTVDTENPETLNPETDEINEDDLDEPENIDTDDLEDTNTLSDEALETQTINTENPETSNPEIDEIHENDAEETKTNELLEESDNSDIQEDQTENNEQTEDLDAESAENEMQNILSSFLLSTKETNKEEPEAELSETKEKTPFEEKHVQNGMNFGVIISKAILYYELEHTTEVIRNIQLSDEEKNVSIENALEVFRAISHQLFTLKNLTFVAMRIQKQSKANIVLEMAGNTQSNKFQETLALHIIRNE